MAHFGREFIWMKTLSKGFGVPVCYCLGIPSASPELSHGYRQMLRLVEMANSEGCKLSAQVFTRPQGILMCWESRSHPFTECKTFDKIWRTGRDPNNGSFLSKNQLWKNSELKKAIILEAIDLATKSSDQGYFGMVLPQSTDNDGPGNLNTTIASPGALAKMYADNAKFVFKFTSSYEPRANDSAEATAKRKNVSVFEVIYDWLCENEGNQVVTHLFMGYANRNLDDLQEMLVHPDTVPGLGDTGAHLGFLSDPTSPTYLLTHWHRDRETGPRLPLEFAVKLHSADTAKVFSLDDRGTIEIGKIADLNVINLQKLQIKAPRFVRDLPTGAGRWIQEVQGYNYTIKTGEITFHNGFPTGRLPGELLRGPGYDPRSQGTKEDSTSQHVGQYGSLTGDLRMALSKLKWEGEQKALETLLAFLGPSKLEKFGVYLNERLPLKNSKLSKL